MSTAGKVLSVLVALMVLVSIYLLSMVSQLNRGWGRGIESVSGQIEQTEQQVLDAQAEAYAIQQQVVAERLITDARINALRHRVEELENRVSYMKEDQLRLELRLNDEQDLIARMQETVAGREQEQAQLQANLNELNTLRDRLASENAEKLENLSSLRERLATLVAENNELLQRVADRSGESDGVENTD